MATTRKVNERSPYYMTVTFKDEAGADLIPSTVEWQLRDLKSNTLVVDWTNATPPATSMVITVEGQYNTIIDDANAREPKCFAVRINQGLASEAYQELHYDVLNLHSVSG